MIRDQLMKKVADWIDVDAAINGPSGFESQEVIESHSISYRSCERMKITLWRIIRWTLIMLITSSLRYQIAFMRWRPSSEGSPTRLARPQPPPGKDHHPMISGNLGEQNHALGASARSVGSRGLQGPKDPIVNASLEGIYGSALGLLVVPIRNPYLAPALVLAPMEIVIFVIVRDQSLSRLAPRKDQSFLVLKF